MGASITGTAWLVSASLVSVSGCSLLIDTDQVQCETSADCLALGLEGFECGEDALCSEVVMAPNEAFACRTAPFADVGTTPLSYTSTFADLVGGEPAALVEVMACPQYDARCENPSAIAMTDELGVLTIDLSVGFRGHLYVPTPPSDPSLVERIVNLYPPPSEDRVEVFPEFVTTLPVLAGLAMLAGAEVTPGMGHLFFLTLDCTGAPLAGVAVSSAVVSETTDVAYIGAGGRPDLSLPGTAPSGEGAIVNLPPGFVTIRATHEDEGKIFEQSVLIEPDTITTVRAITPSPTL